MPSTTNFGWTTPADTDLVKDGAAAIRTLGNGVDASFVDLKGGTTGQILSKNSNTDLDFTWIANDQGDITAVTAGVGLTGGGTAGAVTLTNDMATTITAAGDIVVGTGSGTYDNLPIGTTGQVLTADTTVSPYKVKWATAASGFVGCRLTKSAVQSISNATDTNITWDTEAYDTDGFHSTTTNTSRITIPSGKAGKYLFHSMTIFGNSATGYRSSDFIKNGTTNITGGWFQGNLAANGYNGGTAITVAELAEGDYVELRVYQNSGGNLNFSSGSDTVFGCVYLGA